MTWKSSRGQRAFWTVCATLLLAGCQEQEQIRTYTVSKEIPDLSPAVEKARMLAVMVPRDNEVWFFKLLGPDQAVAEQVAHFDKLVESVRFPHDGKEAIRWTTPDGWQRLPGGNGAFARLRSQGKEPTLEITITRLPPGAKDVKSNVDRWRGQLGLEPLGEADVKKLVGNVKVDGVPGTRIDIVGSGRKQGAMAMPFAGVRPFTFTKPLDWEERPADARNGVRRPAVFGIRDGEHVAEASVVPLAGEGGGALANVNRWRMQLGLEAIDDEQLRKEMRQIPLADGTAPYVDLSGRGPTGPQRILGAWIVHGGRTWFITLKGSPELVGKQKAAFEAFVQSIRFADGGGAAHE